MTDDTRYPLHWPEGWPRPTADPFPLQGHGSAGPPGYAALAQAAPRRVHHPVDQPPTTPGRGPVQSEPAWDPASDPLAVQVYRAAHELLRRILVRDPEAQLQITCEALGMFTRPTLQIVITNELGHRFPLGMDDQQLNHYFVLHPPIPTRSYVSVQLERELGLDAPAPNRPPREAPDHPVLNPTRPHCPVCFEELDDPEAHEGRH